MIDRRAGPGYILVASAAIAWGTWPLILRYAESLSPVPVALESMLVMIALTVVSGVVCLHDRVAVKAKLRDWGGVAWLGVADALNILLYFAALQRASVAVAVLTHYLAPIFVAIAAPFALREKAKKTTYLAVASSFIGLIVLLRPWASDVGPAALAGAALGAGSAVFYASNVLINKRLAGVFSGSELMFYHGFVAVPLLGACVPLEAWTHLHAGALGVVSLGALGPGALAGLCFVWGLRRIPASHASTLTLLEPLVAVVAASVAFNEALGPIALAGAALILGGATLVVLRG